MHIEQHRWKSPRLSRRRNSRSTGTGASPSSFPCSWGAADFEGMGMVSAIEGFINSGKIKPFRHRQRMTNRGTIGDFAGRPQ
jgi:esterase/lipase superfamily enzyme